MINLKKIGNSGIKLLKIYPVNPDIVSIVAFERNNIHEMVSSRGSFMELRKVQARTVLRCL